MTIPNRSFPDATLIPTRSYPDLDVAVSWLRDALGFAEPATLMIRVSHVDATYARAIALGGTGVVPPADHPFGERQAVVKDPAGHSWTLSQTIADVDPAQWGAG